MREPYQEESQIAGGPEYEPTFAFARLTDTDWCPVGIMLYYYNITKTGRPSDDPPSSSSG
jgi:hypothetical protein